jgi:hypothetical protein
MRTANEILKRLPQRKPGDDMSLFDRGKTPMIDEFALKLAADLAQRYPPDLENQQPRKRNPQRLKRAFDATFNNAIAFQREHKLGIYGKARLGNTFRWELKRLGFPEDFIELTTKSLVRFVAAQRNIVASPK